MSTEKLRVGFLGITGCAGCQLSVLFNEDRLLDLTETVEINAFPFIKEFNYERGFDYIFMEGLVASPRDLEEVRKARSATRYLVALGACAHTGCVPAYRNFTLPKLYKHLLYEKQKRIKDVKPTPVEAHVKVDYTIPGCPPDKKEILTFIKDIAAGREPRPYNNPVCVECRRNNNQCLLDVGKPCLGPITRGGCNAVCVNGGFECWGCRGQTSDANLPRFTELLLGKGFSKAFIKERMYTFVGMEVEAKNHGKTHHA